MAIDKKVVTEISIDIDVAMMTNKQCNTKDETTLPKLLRMDDTEANRVLLERFIFWNVIWTHLKRLGWVLDNEGNFESDFIVISPLDPFCNRIMTRNIDFFDDERELIKAFADDPRLNLMEEIRELRECFDDYMIQFSELKSFFKGRNIPWQLNDNKSVLQYMETSVAERKQKRITENRMKGTDDPKTKSDLIRCMLAEHDQQRRVDDLKLARIPADARHRKRLHREMIIAEYEKRKRLNGGKFPTDAPRKVPKQIAPQTNLRAAEVAGPASLLKAQEILQIEQEMKLRKAIATDSQQPPAGLPLGRTVSVSSLPGQLQQREQLPVLGTTLDHRLPAQRRLSGFPPAPASLGPGLVTGGIATSLSSHVAAQPRRISLPLAQTSIEAEIREKIGNANLQRRLPLPSSIPSSASIPQIDAKPDKALKLSWNEIESAFHDLKKPKRNPGMVDMPKVVPLGPKATKLQQMISSAKLNSALGPQTRLQEALLSKKRQRLF